MPNFIFLAVGTAQKTILTVIKHALWHCRQRDSSQEREVQITWMAFLDKQNHYNVKLVYLCLLWWVYVYVLVPWWQLSSSSSRTRFADCCDYGYLPHLILSLSIFLHPSMWSAFQSLIGYPLMPLTSHFLQELLLRFQCKLFDPSLTFSQINGHSRVTPGCVIFIHNIMPQVWI